jgi:uncharacterized membrane protein
MNKKTTFYLVLIALFSALVFVVTYVLPVPIGVVGYVNFGDAVIFISAMVLGPIGGAVAGAVGSTLADVFLGYVTYAPFTFFVKGLEGLVCGLLYGKAFFGKKSWIRRGVSMTIAGIVATLGYFVADFILYGIYAALSNCVFMVLQVGVSMLIAFVALPRVPALYEHGAWKTDAIQKKKDESEDKGESEDKNNTEK